MIEEKIEFQENTLNRIHNHISRYYATTGEEKDDHLSEIKEYIHCSENEYLLITYQEIIATRGAIPTNSIVLTTLAMKGAMFSIIEDFHKKEGLETDELFEEIKNHFKSVLFSIEAINLSPMDKLMKNKPPFSSQDKIFYEDLNKDLTECSGAKPVHSKDKTKEQDDTNKDTSSMTRSERKKFQSRHDHDTDFDY